MAPQLLSSAALANETQISRPTSGYTALLGNHGFQGFLWTQFLGAFNDNVYKMIVSVGAVELTANQMLGARYLALAGAVFVLPFLMFAGYAGQIADRFSKTRVLQATKALEIAIMLAGMAALHLRSVNLLLGVLFLLAVQANMFSPAKYGNPPGNVERGFKSVAATGYSNSPRSRPSSSGPAAGLSCLRDGRTSPWSWVRCCWGSHSLAPSQASTGTPVSRSIGAAGVISLGATAYIAWAVPAPAVRFLIWAASRVSIRHAIAQCEIGEAISRLEPAFFLWPGVLALSSLLGQGRCVVTGIPDERRGERLAVLYARGQFIPSQMIEHLEALGLPALWIPEKNHFHCVEKIPVLGTGKVDLVSVRAIAMKSDRLEAVCGG